MRKEVVVLGFILLVIAWILAVFPERTPESLYYERTIDGFHANFPDDYWCPYKNWGIIVGLIGFVTFIIGSYMPNQSTSDTVN